MTAPLRRNSALSGPRWLTALICLCLSTAANAQVLFLDAPRLVREDISVTSNNARLLMRGTGGIVAGGIVGTGVIGISGYAPAELLPENRLSLVTRETPAMGVTRLINGDAGEIFSNNYFAEQGWKQVPKRGGPQGIDGLFYRVERNGRMHVMVVESKTGGSNLTLTKTKGWQMSREWVLKSVDEQIRQYRKAIAACTDPAQRAELRKQLALLEKIRVQVAAGNYRPRLVRVHVSGGVLHIDFFEVDDTGKNSPSIRKAGNSNHIDLRNPDALGKRKLKQYNEYFKSKRESLLKRIEDPDFVDDLIEKIKQAYRTGEIGDGEADEARFVAKKINEYYLKVVRDRIRLLPARLRPIAMRLLSPLIRLEAWTRTEMATGRLAEKIGNSKYVRALGKGLIVLDVAVTVGATYYDFGRWRAGDISGGYLAFKSGVRSAQLALAYYTVFSPTPEPFTRIVTGVGTAILIVVDTASDPIYNLATARIHEMYRQVDRVERYTFCRNILLESIP